jgi:hypothetical protein
MTDPIYDRSKQPDDRDVAATLREAHPLWPELIRKIKGLEPQIIEEWTFSGKKYGWSLRLGHKKRPIIRMKPNDGFISAGILFGAQAYEAALAADLPAETLQALRDATPYPEGRGIRLEVRKQDDISLILELARIKLAN